ncbi:MAG: bifunctional metallophosphatase/5'-nucleotidase [Hydrogenophaga sp.]|uniref:bifunctional metallophosphatase/5'-nucleotidase n=1 Tax=Hydrogenophaga sp. TaxID=1904254 RepID=UPI002AB8C1AA|nr:bifunctional metallophosphatase/5'-nucleotidase [Hydrogenophaga sp.]MDZ4103129.1 bifunctional metallophosphatase/5'-nucleotidase [Hydrogenophaga sp.]
MAQHLRFGLLATALAFSLSACGGGDGPPPAPVAPLPATAFSLQVLHVADMDSGGDLVTNAKGLSALVQRFRADLPNTVFLSSGDNYIPGPFFNASDDASLNPELGISGAGRGDIEILNLMGLQASAVGNHDLDLGTNFFASLINRSTSGGNTWRGAQFPYLSSNLTFTSDSNLASLANAANDGAEASTLNNKLARYSVITVNGERIGVVGASTPTLPSITSVGNIGVAPSGANVGNIDALVAEIQPSVTALTSQGINKVVLLAHMQQLQVEQQLATRLRGVDLIIAGGSNTGLYDANDRVRPGDTNGGVYPLSYTSPNSEPVLVVNVDADYKYLGRIVLPFDAQGRVITGRLDTALNGAWATDTDGLTRAGLTLADAMPGVVAITNKIQAVITAKDGALFGAASVYLEGDRVLVRNQETNLGNLTAEANLAYAQTLDGSTTLSLKNGGGIRSSLGSVDAPAGSTTGVKGITKANPSVNKQAGDISQLDIEFALRFNNGLSVLSVTPAELKTLLEHGVSDWLVNSTQGKFPQVAGLRFSFDPSQPAGSRVRTIVVDDPDGTGPLSGPEVVYAQGAFTPEVAARNYRLVTLGFLADGGDSYPFATLSAANRVNLAAGSGNVFTTPGGEQNAFSSHMAARYPRSTPYGVADTAAAADTRIQNLSLRADSLPQAN